MPTIPDIAARHNAYQNSMLSTFDSHLREIVLRAQGQVLAKLQLKLKLTDGVIDQTPGNMLTLRNSGKLFMNELEEAGYSRLVNAFVGEFRGTLPFLQETLEELGKQAGQDWSAIAFTQKDFNLLAGAQANAVWAIEDVVQAAAGTAITRGLFGVAGLKFGKLVELLTTRLEMSIGSARTIADTSMSTFFATASDRAYQIIEKDLPAQVLRFVYSGPTDKLEREFCRHLTTTDKDYTREEIAEMSNGMLPNVMITRGGWNCRHQWNVSTKALEGTPQEPAVAIRPAA